MSLFLIERFGKKFIKDREAIISSKFSSKRKVKLAGRSWLQFDLLHVLFIWRSSVSVNCLPLVIHQCNGMFCSFTSSVSVSIAIP